MPKTTYSRCVRITRTDGVVLGFTSSDRPLRIEGITYSPSAAPNSVAITRDIELNVDNVQIVSVLMAEGVNSQDLINGRFNDAKITVAKIDYLNPPNSLIEGEVLLSGRVGKIDLTDTAYTMEIRGLSSLLNQSITKTASPICRWSLGDANCTVDLTNLSAEGSVANTINNKQMAIDLEASFELAAGLLEFTSGINQGLIYTIDSYSSPDLTLMSEIYVKPQTGDTFRVVAGCQRNQFFCRDVYNNVRNFGGEPTKWNVESDFFPGTDRLVSPRRNRD